MFTMARIKAVRGKGKEFFLNHLSCNDYYSEKERVEGVWHGRLAEDFGIANQTVSAEIFSLFQQNINPVTHQKLTQRTVAGGIRFYDFQCSAQKSVSVMSLFDKRLIGAHRRSVAFAMKELERFAAVRIRNGANVNTRNHEITGNMVYASFQHDTSRLLDPQLHTHNVVCNVTKTKDGVYKALENSEMCRAIRYCGRVYQNMLAMECRKLGYEIEESFDFRGNVKGFEIKGVSSEIQERFSKRTRDIDDEIARQERNLGRTLTAAERHEISLETRSFKLTETDSASVRNHQLEQFSREEMEILERLAHDAYKRKVENENINLNGVIDEILPELFERVSVLNEEQIIAEILTQNLGHIPLERLKKDLANHRELYRLPGNYLVPKVVMEAEQYAIDAVEREKGLYQPLNEKFIPFNGSEKRKAQREVIQGILRSRDRFVLLRGVAGSGKTSTLKELARGLKGNPLVLAPTNSAVEVLKQEGFHNSQTVASFLLNPPQFNGLLIVDESGLNSLHDGVALLRLAESREFRILFVGDSGQHSAVDRGDFFRLLENHSNIERFTLKEIHRQQVEEYRLGVKACADGDFKSAFEKFDRNGFIRESETDYLKKAAEHFTKLFRDKEQVIAVAPTHRECDALTAEIRSLLPLGKVIANAQLFRSARLSRSKLRKAKIYAPGQNVLFVRKLKNIAEAGTVVTISKVDKKYLHLSNGKSLRLSLAADYIALGEMRNLELRQGDLIQFQVNLREQKIFNGNLARITGTPGVVELLNQDLTPKKDGLRRLPEGFAAYDYGWVTTSHKSQGRTAQHVVIAAQKLDRKAFYVSCSRGRQSLALFCPDKKYLKLNLLKNDDARRNAVDLLPPPPRKEYLTSAVNKVKEYLAQYKRKKEAFEKEIAEYRRIKSSMEKELAEHEKELNNLREQARTADWEKEIYSFYKGLPLYQRVWLTVKGDAPPDPKRHGDYLHKTNIQENVCNTLREKISFLHTPRFEMNPRIPLSCSEKLTVWLHRLFRRKEDHIPEHIRLLNQYGKTRQAEDFRHWIKFRKPEWSSSLINELYKTMCREINPLPFSIMPQSESQYKTFYRAEKELLKTLEEPYSVLYTKKQQEKKEQQVFMKEKRLKRAQEERERREREFQQELREEQERRDLEQRQERVRAQRELERKREMERLSAERRKNPMTDAQRRLLEDLYSTRHLGEVPAELSTTEASELISRIVADDPIHQHQIQLLQRRMDSGDIPCMNEAELSALKQKDYTRLMKIAHKHNEDRLVERTAISCTKSKGMDI